MRRKLAEPQWSGLARSLTMLRTFLIASAGILAAGAFALSSTLSQDLRQAALDDEALDVAAYADAVLTPAVVKGSTIVVAPRVARHLRSSTSFPGEVRGLRVYAPGGRLVFSTDRADRAVRRRTSPELTAVVRIGRAHAEVVEPLGDARAAVAVWAPLHSRRGRVVGAAEVTLDDSVANSLLDETRATVWLVVAIVFGLIWLLLALLVRGASVRLRRQNDVLAARSHELLDSSKELEANLLETIETLNAAVEARDPYTAGHSQRVRRVALAIGRELRLPARQLGTLGTAALFHDIGKIGMPDSILTKPDRLDRAEAAIMREHVLRGAEIVSRITSLRDCVPAIRHHHERWDGLGYPDRIRGTAIPVEAAIIAIADAWDAMTTDRPYAAALDTEEAMMQIRAGRGRQFSPVVVDAFWAVVRRRPSEVLPAKAPDATETAVAV